MAVEDVDVDRFAEQFQRFLEAMATARRPKDSALRALVRDHIGLDR